MADDVRFDIRAQDRTRDAFASVDRSLGALTRGLGAVKVAVAATFIADSVAFRATPGERVMISPAGGGHCGGVTVINTIDARGAEVGVEQRIRQVFALKEPGMRDRADNAGANAGGPFAKAVGRWRRGMVRCY